MPTALITGANRGIGLAFCGQYAGQGWRVFAICRHPDEAAALTDLAGIAGDVTIHEMDVADPASVAAAAAGIGGTPIDLLINNAGIYGSPGQDFGNLDFDGWAHAFRVNTMGPLIVAQAFQDNVAASDTRLIVCLTSRMGSIADGGGGYIQYRSSKAALNMAARAMTDDLARRRVAVVLFHPEWVQTNMGGKSAPLSPRDSVAGMARVIDGLSIADSGKFFNYDGSEIPW